MRSSIAIVVGLLVACGGVEGMEDLDGGTAVEQSPAGTTWDPAGGYGYHPPGLSGVASVVVATHGPSLACSFVAEPGPSDAVYIVTHAQGRWFPPAPAGGPLYCNGVRLEVEPGTGDLVVTNASASRIGCAASRTPAYRRILGPGESVRPPGRGREAFHYCGETTGDLTLQIEVFPPGA